MSVKCEEPIGELTVQVWLLYDHLSFKYCTFMQAGCNYGQTYKQTGGRFDNKMLPADLSGQGHKNILLEPLLWNILTKLSHIKYKLCANAQHPTFVLFIDVMVPFKTVIQLPWRFVEIPRSADNEVQPLVVYMVLFLHVLDGVLRRPRGGDLHGPQSS